jgi:hypothetical protein
MLEYRTYAKTEKKQTKKTTKRKKQQHIKGIILYVTGAVVVVNVR